MKRTLLLTFGALAIAGSAQAQIASLPPAAPRARGPELALAVEAAQVAVATCRAKGFKTSVLVVDSAGVPVVMLSGDGATERTQGVAAGKAATVMKYGVASIVMVERAKADPALDAELKSNPKIGAPLSGALPLKVGGELIGAVSVAGAPVGNTNDECGKAGIDKIASRLR